MSCASRARFRRETVSIFGPRGWIDAPGYVTDAVPGLAVARFPRADGLVTPFRSPWSVTHVRSGRYVDVFWTCAAAKRVLLAIGPLADWTEGYRRFRGDEELVHRIKVAILAQGALTLEAPR